MLTDNDDRLLEFIAEEFIDAGDGWSIMSIASEEILGSVEYLNDIEQYTFCASQYEMYCSRMLTEITNFIENENSKLGGSNV